MLQTLTIESCQCSVKILCHLLVYFMGYSLLHLASSTVCLILNKIRYGAVIECLMLENVQPQVLHN